MSTPNQGNSTTSPAATERSPSQSTKRKRVLACVLCQQRKVKCDREFPCVNCTRSQVQCVPAATLYPRQRRRRFAERELLDRLRHYESLLHQGNIGFEPLHQDGPSTEKKSLGLDHEGPGDRSEDDQQLGDAVHADQSLSPSIGVKTETVYEAKSFWRAMNHRSQSRYPDDENSDNPPGDDEIHEAVMKDAWKEMNRNNDHLLFGSRETAVDISTLHPEQVQIFRLWQIYIDNVNPLLKVTHTPTLQARIIDAATNVANIKPNLAALMFGIYCVSILSLEEDECRTLFATPKERLLTKYQFACQQALLNCGFLHSTDRDCLTALFLYLISVRPSIIPQSLSSMLGVAIRVAQRMGLHNEASYAKYPALEAEMRRRLWWSLVLFDSRIFEMADWKTTMLNPTWDCKTPLNLNDFDLRPEMKDPPAVQERSSEALFAVVRSEMGNFIRHSSFYLDFTAPALKAIAQNLPNSPIPPDGHEMSTLETHIEETHLKHLNPENPLHYMTIWTSRNHLAKNRLLEHYSKFPHSSIQQTDSQRDIALSHALRMLECETRLSTSPLTKGYHWFLHLHFPFPAYIHIVQDLKTRPFCPLASKAWDIMSENYAAHFRDAIEKLEMIPVFRVFANIIFQAWRARESTEQQPPPRIIADTKEKLERMMRLKQQQSHQRQEQQRQEDISSIDPQMSMPTSDSGYDSLLSGMGPTPGQGQGFPGLDPRLFNSMPTMDFDLDDMENWNPMDWGMGYRCDW